MNQAHHGFIIWIERLVKGVSLAAGNNNAESMLTRDVNNMRRYYGRLAPELLDTQYAKEI